MPYEVRQNVPGCSGYAVVKPGSSKVVGCHETRAQANAQVAALYAAEPDMAVKMFDDAALLRAHDQLHKSGTLSAADAEIHHLIADEIRSRGLDHSSETGGIHDVVVTMSSLRMPMRSLAKMLGPNEVNAIAQMAIQNGTSFAEVAELLTANGWMLRAEPVMPEDGEEDETEEPEEEGEEVDEEYARLVPRQIALVEAYEKIAEEHGLFDQSATASGAHYISAADNVFADAGMNCANCVFYHGGGVCEIVSGVIEPMAVCKLWVIESALITESPPIEKAESYDPPAGAQTAAERALRWISEGYAGDGFTAVGAARARDIANGRSLSADTVSRMASFFARHSVNRGSSWDLRDGKPTPWRVAWDAWGGDAGRTWAERISERMRSEKARGVREGDFVRWRSSGGIARGRVEHVMTEGTLGVPDSDFSVNADPDDPALLIRIYREGPDGWEETETLVGHRSSTVTRIEPLTKHMSGSHDQSTHAGGGSGKPVYRKQAWDELKEFDRQASREAKQWYQDQGYPSLISGSVGTTDDVTFDAEINDGQKPLFSETERGKEVVAERKRLLERAMTAVEDPAVLEAQEAERKIRVAEIRRKEEAGLLSADVESSQMRHIENSSTLWGKRHGLRDTDDPPSMGNDAKAYRDGFEKEYGAMEGAYAGDRVAVRTPDGMSPGYGDRVNPGTNRVGFVEYTPGSPMDAHEAYTHNAGSLNRAALGLDDSPLARQRVASMDRLIEEHGVPSPRAMIRGSSGMTTEMMPEMSLKKGDTFVEPKYGSWSTNVQVARRFSGAGNAFSDRDGVDRTFSSIMRVTNGHLVKSVPGTFFEEERILPRNVRYKVVGIRDRRGKTGLGRRAIHRTIDVEIIPDTEKVANNDAWSTIHDPGILSALDERYKPAIMLLSRGPDIEVDTEDDEDEDEGEMMERSLIIKQVEERRFTLGPWYVPNRLDAHEEWTDPDELQAALWDYVRKGKREIRLQHVKDTRAGEWVEAMTLPFPMEAPLINTETGVVEKRVFPAGTVMLGVVWDDWAWDMVKAGQIRGYSMGGSSERVDEEPPIMVDLQTR